eukprot:3706169-Alexandrium_andersonii.AAC.1
MELRAIASAHQVDVRFLLVWEAPADDAPLEKEAAYHFPVSLATGERVRVAKFFGIPLVDGKLPT